MTQQLSPATQAVLDAANQAYDQAATVAQGAAAALRAVALNFRTEMKSSVPNDFVRGVLATVNALEEIASELETQ